MQEFLKSKLNNEGGNNNTELDVSIETEERENTEARINALVGHLEQEGKETSEELERANKKIPEPEKIGLFDRLRRSPFSKGLQAIILASALLSAGRAGAEKPPPPETSDKLSNIDLTKAAVGQGTKKIIEDCKKRCDPGYLENKVQEWLQEGDLGSDSLKWEVRSYWGSLGYGVDITLANPDKMVSRYGNSVKSEVIATLDSNNYWSIDRIKDMPVSFSGLSSPSMALQELVKHFGKQKGLKGSLKATTAYRFGSLGGRAILILEDGNGNKTELSKLSNRIKGEEDEDGIDRTLVHALEKELELSPKK